MSELIQDTDPGKLPPRTRVISSEIADAMKRGWRPSELAEKLGVAPSWLSVCIAELRTALGFLNGVFPTPSDEEYAALRESIARRGVEVPIVVDEHGIIDGHVRVRALMELAEICELVEHHPIWSDIATMAETDREHCIDAYGQEAAEASLRLAELGPVVELALERRWEDPPIDQREGLDFEERRRLAVALNAGRRQLERGDLRLLIEVELMVDPDRVDGEIAALVGCSRQWVQQVRVQLEEDERHLVNPQVEDEVQVLAPWRQVAAIACPHCAHELAVLRAGRDFQLRELTAGDG